MKCAEDLTREASLGRSFNTSGGRGGRLDRVDLALLVRFGGTSFSLFVCPLVWQQIRLEQRNSNR
ncbi:MAG: hypothetical protein D6816_06955 [Bacteroidetes bacterium]|nr:MAG: hypothetical protein D6816_06955 [Bacteroidota bacterium]